MSVYTIQAPAGSYGEAELEDSAFLREGFSWGAFFFAIFWLLWHRLWVTAALWIIVCVGFTWLSFTVLSFGSFLLIALALHILLGLEAHALLRRRYARHDYRLMGVISAESREVAERRFFSRFIPEAPQTPSGTGTPPTPPRPGHSDDVLGLFPEPETGH